MNLFVFSLRSVAYWTQRRDLGYVYELSEAPSRHRANQAPKLTVPYKHWGFQACLRRPAGLGSPAAMQQTRVSFFLGTCGSRCSIGMVSPGLHIPVNLLHSALMWSSTSFHALEHPLLAAPCYTMANWSWTSSDVSK